MKKIIAGVLLVITMLCAVSCAEKECKICGEKSSKGKEENGVFYCQECLDNPMRGIAKGLVDRYDELNK